MDVRLGLLKTITIACGMLVFTGCGTPRKYAATDKVYKQKVKGFANTLKAMPPTKQGLQQDGKQSEFVGTVNFGIRKPNFVVIHHTAQNNTDQTLKTFTLEKTETSAHYVIGRDGKIVQMANDYLRANHAGAGKWGNVTDMNSCSIGIELDNNGTTDPWPNVQIVALCNLLASLKQKYNIPQANFIGHADFAPGRKNDPKNFPWKILAKKGFGYWYDDTLKMPPADFNTTDALRLIGYNVKNLSGAINAFKIHWVQVDTSNSLTEIDKLILYNVYQKYL